MDNWLGWAANWLGWFTSTPFTGTRSLIARKRRYQVEAVDRTIEAQPLDRLHVETETRPLQYIARTRRTTIEAEK